MSGKQVDIMAEYASAIIGSLVFIVQLLIAYIWISTNKQIKALWEYKREHDTKISEHSERLTAIEKICEERHKKHD